jgi:hypothetical protein
MVILLKVLSSISMPHLKKCRTRNRYIPWFTPDLTALDQHKKIQWHTALASNSPLDMQLQGSYEPIYTGS